MRERAWIEEAARHLTVAFDVVFFAPVECGRLCLCEAEPNCIAYRQDLVGVEMSHLVLEAAGGAQWTWIARAMQAANTQYGFMATFGCYLVANVRQLACRLVRALVQNQAVEGQMTDAGSIWCFANALKAEEVRILAGVFA